MKNYISLLCISLAILTSCSDNTPLDNSSFFHFDLNDDGIIVSVTSEEKSSSQSTLGSTGARGRYTARAIERYVDKTNLGIVLNLPVTLDANKEFSLEVFESLFAPNKTYELGGQFSEDAALYYLKIEDDVIKTYASVSREFLPNVLKIISKEYIGKGYEGRRMHRVVYEFSSYMENMDDSSDSFEIENGVVEVMVSEFNN